MYVIVADFTVDPAEAAAFREVVTKNAGLSVANEPGCRQFDVCVDPARDDRIYLYEVYDDEAAFQAHLASEHFHEFDARVADWIRARR